MAVNMNSESASDDGRRTTHDARRSSLAGWALLVGFTLLFGSISLVYPFGRDQMAYAFMGDAMLHGMTLYRDVPMMLMPLTGLLHALALVLFGRTMTAIRILDLLWTVATACVLSRLAGKVFGRPWLGVIAGLLYSFTYYSFNFWNTAEVDGFLNLPVAISIYLLVSGLRLTSDDRPLTAHGSRHSSSIVHRSWFIFLLAGLLMEIALLFKHTIGLLLPGAALVLIFAAGRRRAANWRAAAWFCGGCLATGLVALLIFVRSGALPAFIRLQVGSALPYSRLIAPETSPLRGFLVDFPPFAFPVFLLGILGLIPSLARRFAGNDKRRTTDDGRRSTALILVWLAATIASVAAQRKFFAYHYLPILPPLAVLSAVTIVTGCQPFARHFASVGRRVVLVAVVLAGLAFVAGYPERLQDLVQVASNRLSLHDLWSRSEYSPLGFSVSENVALAKYLSEETRPNDRVASFGIDPPFTFPAWREPVLRFTTTTGADSAEWKLTAEFRAHPPDVLTVKHGERLLPWLWTGSRDARERLMAFAVKHGEVVPLIWARNRDAYGLMMAFPELHDLVAARYELEARVGHVDVLRLMNSDSVLPVPGAARGLLSEDLNEALDWLKGQSAGGRDSGSESVRSILWPCRVPDNLDSATGAKMISDKAANRILWLEEKKLDDMLPALSVWIANDDRPFARQDPFRLQGEGTDYDAGGISFVVRHRCRNGLVFVYDVRRTPAP
jgi:hypothetical protein